SPPPPAAPPPCPSPKGSAPPPMATGYPAQDRSTAATARAAAHITASPCTRPQRNPTALESHAQTRAAPITAACSPRSAPPQPTARTASSPGEGPPQRRRSLRATHEPAFLGADESDSAALGVHPSASLNDSPAQTPSAAPVLRISPD